MPTFEFPLDRLLRVRRQQERLAEVEALRARAALDVARARVAELKVRLVEVAAGLQSCVGRTMPSHQWAASTDLSARLGQSIGVAEAIAAVAQANFATADRKRAGLAAEVEALQTLRAEHLEAFLHEQNRAIQDRVDEAGLRQWMAEAAESE